MAGRIARARSVTMDTAEKKKLTLLLRMGLQTPIVSPHSAVMGWQMLAMTRMNTMLATAVAPMMSQMVHTNRRRESAMRRRVIQMLDLMGTVHDE